MDIKVIYKSKIQEVSEWFLNKKSLSLKKLQALVYYAYAWTITLMNDDEYSLNNRLFNDRPEAWIHGARFPKLHHMYKKYGFSEIPLVNNKPTFPEDIEDILEQVWEVYGGFNANQLESIMHQEKPYINARRGISPDDVCTNKIDDYEIFKYYSKRIGE